MEFWDKAKAQYESWTRITPTNLMYDRALLWLFIVLLLIGLLAVSSASIPVGTRLFNDPFYFAKRDALYLLLSCVFFISLCKFPLKNGNNGMRVYSC